MRGRTGKREVWRNTDGGAGVREEEGNDEKKGGGEQGK